jgi:hypothetical protein
MATNLSISPAKAQEIMKRADGAMAKLNRIRGKTEEKVGEVFKLVETVGAAAAVGTAHAKWGEVTIGPDIPLVAAIGAALSLSAFLDMPGKYSEHLHNIGNGVLGGYALIEAVKMSGGVILSKEEYEKLTGQAPKQIVQGEDSQTQVEKSNGEVRRLAPAARAAREVFDEVTEEAGIEVTRK